MKSKKLNIAKSNNSIAAYGIAYPDLGTKFTLVVDTETTVTVPGGVNVAIFSYNPGSVVQSTTGDVAITAITTTPSPSTERINATAAWVKPGETLRFLSSQADSVAISYYTNEEPLS
jgi:hypothetical protein